jgi:homocysteine S-methyltransferase
MTATLLLDGGTGSELRRRRVRFVESVWSAAANIDHVDTLVAIHSDYIAAGADVITANTFATTRFVLEAGGLGDRFEEINRAAITAARTAADAADRHVLVAASLSCCPPFLDMSARPAAAIELRDYRELAAFLAGNGVDLLLLEMLQHPEPAARACKAASESGLPYWAGISCRQRNGLVSFDEPAAPVAAVLDAIVPFDPAGIAVMHSPLSAMPQALRSIRARWTGAIGAYAELPYDEDPTVAGTERVTPEAYATTARQWLREGLQLLGGCCGTTPAHIAALRNLLDSSE